MAHPVCISTPSTPRHSGRALSSKRAHLSSIDKNGHPRCLFVMRKNSLNMKTTFVSGLLVMLALWFGYSLGYHHGRRDESSNWLSRLQFQNGKVVLGPGKVEVHPTPAVNSIPDIRRK